MKTILSCTLAAAFLFVSPVMALAAKTKGAKSFKGKITAVDVKEHSVTLSSKKSGETKTFKVGKHTKVSVDKVKGKHFEDLAVGMKAKVKAGKGEHADSIKAKSHKGKKKKNT
jgi:hypothetical protein